MRDNSEADIVEDIRKWFIVSNLVFASTSILLWNWLTYSDDIKKTFQDILTRDDVEEYQEEDASAGQALQKKVEQEVPSSEELEVQSFQIQFEVEDPSQQVLPSTR